MGNIIFLILVIISFAGLYKLFEKAGVAPWKALVPVYNFCIASKIIDKPWWWGLIMIVPGVNLIMYGVYGFNIARAYNKRSTNDLLFASFLPYIFFVKIGFDANIKYIGVKDIKKESALVKNWLDPIIFAVVAASIIRTFFFEAFTIPTSSLEKSLMVGDFLFVNKVCYGAKVPQTPIAFPFAHHTLPFTKSTKSYLEWLKLPYFRLPGYSSPKNGEIVVFNYPDGDTVALNAQETSYYQLVRDIAGRFKQEDGNQKPDHVYQEQGWNYVNSPEAPFGKIVGRPVDKREHYVKRCVAIAGDKLEIKDGEVYINDKLQPVPEKAQHHYYMKLVNSQINVKWLDDHDIYVDESAVLINRGNDLVWQYFDNKRLDYFAGNPLVFAKMIATGDTSYYLLNLTKEKAEEIKKMPGCLSLEKRVDPKNDYDERIFPHNPRYRWNNDNFGPLTLPKEGLTVAIDTGNLCLYEKMLSTYDDGIHQVSKSGGQVLYDGKPITSYTFKQGYYWMMGDNRHNSADSRSWGVVPFDHVVGRPVFVWFSMKDKEKNPISGGSLLGSLFKNSHDGKFRWDRFMCYVGESGLVSCKIPVLAIIIGLWGLSYWNKKRKLKVIQKK